MKTKFWSVAMAAALAVGGFSITQVSADSNGDDRPSCCSDKRQCD